MKPSKDTNTLADGSHLSLARICGVDHVVLTTRVAAAAGRVGANFEENPLLLLEIHGKDMIERSRIVSYEREQA